MRKAQHIFSIAIVASVLLLQACGSAEKRGEVSNVIEDGFGGSAIDNGLGDSNRVQHSIGNAAVVAIWERAEESRLTGDVEGAIAQLERAVRIDPNDPVIWSRMAELRLQQGKNIAAENIATKSNQLNNEEKPVLQYRNWLIIAQAREANGDIAGAEEAKLRASVYR